MTGSNAFTTLGITPSRTSRRSGSFADYGSAPFQPETSADPLPPVPRPYCHEEDSAPTPVSAGHTPHRKKDPLGATLGLSGGMDVECGFAMPHRDGNGNGIPAVQTSNGSSHDEFESGDITNEDDLPQPEANQTERGGGWRLCDD